MSDSTHATQLEALLQAIEELREEGGGTLWLHRPTCAYHLADEEACACRPVPIEVPARQ